MYRIYLYYKLAYSIYQDHSFSSSDTCASKIRAPPKAQKNGIGEDLPSITALQQMNHANIKDLKRLLFRFV